MNHRGSPLPDGPMDLRLDDRRDAEEALRVSEAEARSLAAELKAVMDSIPALTFIAHDPACRTMTSSREAHEVLRVPAGANTSKSAPAEERPTNFRVLQEGRELAAWELPVQRAAASGKPVRDAEVTLEFDDGRTVDIYGHAVPLFDDRGRVRGSVGAFIDITERKRAERALQESESRFRKLFESDLMGIGIPDRYGAFVEANDELLRIVGYTREELRAGAVRWDTMTPPEYAEIDRQHIAEAAVRGSCTPYEKEYIRKDGTRVPILCGYALLEGSEDQYIGFVQDLTLQRSAEEALRRAEKLSAAGRLAASIAHEINNPLASVTNTLYLALRDPTLNPETLRYLKVAEQELARASQVAARTLRFHKQSTPPVATAPGRLMDSALTLFASRLSRVQVEREYATEDRLVCYDQELRQVFTNLIANALDAMGSGGTLRIRIRTGRSWKDGMRPGIRVSIADTGPGIAPHIRKHMFEPFFTTKPTTGTGLGLWLAAEGVRKHQGIISLRSATGAAKHGTVFSLFLPHSG